MVKIAGSGGGQGRLEAISVILQFNSYRGI